MNSRPYVLVLGTADWEQPIATNQHYVVRELCRDGFSKVDFVESLGLRTPQISRRDMKRMLDRARMALLAGGTKDYVWQRAKPEGLQVISPLVVPFHHGVCAALNTRLLRNRVANWISFDGPKVLWTYSPVTYGLEHFADRAFYHCVDLLGKVPGIDEALIESAERQLAHKGVSAAATSGIVHAHLQRMGFDDIRLWENVADTSTVLAAKPKTSERVPGRVIFAGNLAPNKISFPLLEVLADSGLDVRVAGPHAEGGGSDRDAFDALIKHGVTYLGMLSLPELARELVTATVGLIPYKINEYTRGVSPLKTYEYLAAGLTVVSTPVPSVAGSEGDVVVVPAEEMDLWIRTVSTRSSIPTAVEIDRRVSLAQAHSWVGRGDIVRSVIREAL